jgi:MFS family permease
MTLSPGSRIVASHALAATAMSMPWPFLLAEVWSATGSDSWLGVTGAARMAPYVALSASAGIMADRFSRSSVLRWSTIARAGLLVAMAAALLGGQLALAVVLAVLTVAAGTPSYPAAVAALPGLAGPRTARLTSLLVTAEVAAFVVGPAVGGLLLGLSDGRWSIVLSAGLALAAWPLLRGVRAPRGSVAGSAPTVGRLSTVLQAPGVPVAVALVALDNLVESAASIGLLTLSHEHWGTGNSGFGIATAALGFGALAAPLFGTFLRMRGALLVSGTGLALSGALPSAVAAAGPLAVAGASGTVVECSCTEVLQRSVPDRARAFALGLADAIMVLAAMLGALIAPGLASRVGPVPLFLGLGASLVLAAVLLGRIRYAGSEPASLPRPAEGLQLRSR